jgi:hypothetical protein
MGGFRLVTRVHTVTKDPELVATLAIGFLNGIIANNQATIREFRRRGRPLPTLYESGVVYMREPWQDFEEFADVLTVLRRGWGDCDDLVAWKVAELREDGFFATPRIYWRPKSSTMHAQLRHPPRCMCPMCRGRFEKGKIEDPSRLLGM